MQRKTLVEKELQALDRIEKKESLTFSGRSVGKAQFVHDILLLRNALMNYERLLWTANELNNENIDLRKKCYENVLGVPALYYSQRKALWDQYSIWCETNHVVRDSEAIFVWLCEKNLLDIGKAEEYAPLKLKVINLGKEE